MPNPLKEAVDWVEAHKPAGSTVSAAFPTGPLSAIQVQVAWDGSPSDADNREDATIRVTVWAPRNRPNDATDAAETLRALLLAGQGDSRPNFQRVDRGTGRLPGVDPDTELPFCSFTVQPVFRALAT
jgi:hypothetical protein